MPTAKQTTERKKENVKKDVPNETIVEEVVPDDELDVLHDTKPLLEWKAPGRPFRKRSKEFFINSILIILALEVILFLFSQYLLMLVILSVAFLSFALAITPPEHLHYRISAQGVAVGEHFYLWQELYDFYFLKKGGEDVLHIRTQAYYPGELIIALGGIPRDVIRQLLMVFLPYREIVRKTYTEKAGDWMSKNFPLEKDFQHKVPAVAHEKHPEHPPVPHPEPHHVKK